MSKPDLTKNQTAVMRVLDKAESAMSAYDLLDKLRSKGLRAPLQVYRALDKLVEHGLVHRLESLNAFVACQHAACSVSETTTAFTICNECGRVDEVADEGLALQLSSLAAPSQFHLEKSTVELRGLCRACC